MNDSSAQTASVSAPTPSFHAWVMDQANRDDAIGDLARDYKIGVRVRAHGRARSPEGLIKILQKYNASQAAIDTAARLQGEWEVRPIHTNEGTS